MNTTARRITELTDQQRQAIDHARRLLAPHFPGETLRLYVPAQAIEMKLAREARIRDALGAGLTVRQIARTEGCSVGLVSGIKGRVRRGTFAAFTFPP